MMTSIRRRLWLRAATAFFAFLLLTATVFGGTPCHLFTHNAHDTLVLGEIIALDDETMTIRAAGFIVSAGSHHRDDAAAARYLRQEANQLLRPTIARVAPQWEGQFDQYEVGDYVIASLNRYRGRVRHRLIPRLMQAATDALHRDGDRFVIANGIYRVDSLDYQTLTVEGAFHGQSNFYAEFYTDFVNSRGWGGMLISADASEPVWGYVLIGLIGVGIAAVVVVGLRAGRKLRHASDR